MMKKFRKWLIESAYIDFSSAARITKAGDLEGLAKKRYFL